MPAPVIIKFNFQAVNDEYPGIAGKMLSTFQASKLRNMPTYRYKRLHACSKTGNRLLQYHCTFFITNIIALLLDAVKTQAIP